MEKGLTSVDLPINYFPDDDPTKAPVVTWRSTGQLLYSNWLNFYVYQSTPYDIAMDKLSVKEYEDPFKG